jgi:hypothetical protein
MLYSGIDLHKRSLVTHTLDADGTTTCEAQLKRDRGAVLAAPRLTFITEWLL